MSIVKSLRNLLAGLVVLGALLFPELRQFLGDIQVLDAPAREQPAKDAPATAPGRLAGEVLRLADGDSFRMRSSDGRELEIRMHGIDAPERNQPYGREAGRALESLLKGKRIEVEVVEEDTYGRLVSVVYVEGRNINLAMVQGGHAWWYEYYAANKRELQRAQREASSARLGLWGATEKPVAPWDWRRRQR